MRRIVLVSGVLGGGTALVFALAALTATLFPTGTVVNQTWNGGWVERGGWGMDVPVPAPMPVIEPEVFDPGIVVEGDGFDALPGDTVGGSDGAIPEEPATP